MIPNASVSEALHLYSRGLISRSGLERELCGWEEKSKPQHRSRFWRPGTTDMEQDSSGAWKVQGRSH